MALPERVVVLWVPLEMAARPVQMAWVAERLPPARSQATVVMSWVRL